MMYAMELTMYRNLTTEYYVVTLGVFLKKINSKYFFIGKLNSMLNIISYTSNHFSSAFLDSIRTYGFAVIENHPIPRSQFECSVTDWHDYFHDTQKHDDIFEHDEGYFSTTSVETPLSSGVRDFKEFAHFYNHNLPKMVKNNHLQLFNSMYQFSLELCSILEEGMPLRIKNNLCRSLIDMVKGCTKNCLRVNHYPPIPQNNRALLRSAPHKDINFLTLLLTSDDSGLEVLSEGAYLPVPSSNHYLIVNIGETLEAISDGFYKSNTHQVRSPCADSDQNRSRFSLPLFLHAHPDVTIDKHGHAKDFLLYKLREIGHNIDDAYYPKPVIQKRIDGYKRLNA